MGACQSQSAEPDKAVAESLDNAVAESLDNAAKALEKAALDISRHSAAAFGAPAKSVRQAPAHVPKPPGGKSAAVSLGVIRLDYDYPPALGDIDHSGTFDYDVFYRVVPGLTFEMAQSGKLSPLVQESFVEAIVFLRDLGVSVITGDCGFMMYFQALARKSCKLPICMSALAQLPTITCGYDKSERIAIFTANAKALNPMRTLIEAECGVDPQDRRFVIVGCEHIEGFEAVAVGGKVNTSQVEPGMVAKAKEVIKEHPQLRAFLFECTELPPYSDAVRAATGLPVYDAVTACDFFISGRKDNPRYGLNDWQDEWDGVQDEYHFGDNLTESQKKDLVMTQKTAPLRPAAMPPTYGGARTVTC